MESNRWFSPDRLMLVFLLALFACLVPFTVLGTDFSGSGGWGPVLVRLGALYAMLVAGAVFLTSLVKRLGLMELRLKFLELELKRRTRGGRTSAEARRRPPTPGPPSQSQQKTRS